MLKHPDPQVQELLDMLELQRESAMVECANLRVANKALQARILELEASASLAATPTA